MPLQRYDPRGSRCSQPSPPDLRPAGPAPAGPAPRRPPSPARRFPARRFPARRFPARRFPAPPTPAPGPRPARLRIGAALIPPGFPARPHPSSPAVVPPDSPSTQLTPTPSVPHRYDMVASAMHLWLRERGNHVVCDGLQAAERLVSPVTAVCQQRRSIRNNAPSASLMINWASGLARERHERGIHAVGRGRRPGIAATSTRYHDIEGRTGRANRMNPRFTSS